MSTVAVETKAAKLKCATVTVTSDGPATLTLLGLRAGATVSENGAALASSSSAGSAAVPVATGSNVFSYC